MKDFVVAVCVRDGKAFRVWEGEAYRRFNSLAVHQFRISMAKDERDAGQRAEEIFRKK